MKIAFQNKKNAHKALKGAHKNLKSALMNIKSALTNPKSVLTNLKSALFLQHPPCPFLNITETLLLIDIKILATIKSVYINDYYPSALLLFHVVVVISIL